MPESGQIEAILVIDIGTSSMRGILYNEKGQALKVARVIQGPDYHSDNRVEQDPLSWEKGLVRIIQELNRWSSEERCHIKAVSVTSQRSSIIPVDRNGGPIAPAIMWQDRRAYELCREFNHSEDEVYQCTGSKINPIFAAPKIAWLHRHEPDVYRRAFKIIAIPDYLIHLLIWDFVTDYTYGSRTSLMNLQTLEWDGNMLELFAVDQNKLSRLVPQGSIVGYTTEEFERRTGLAARTPVISAGGDQQCGALGAGIFTNGSLQVTIGTGAYLIAPSDRPVFDPMKRLICNVSAVRGKYILESTIPAASSVYNWFFKNFYQGYPECPAMADTIDKEAALAPPGSNGVLMFPHFQGRGSPDWNVMAKGMFFNVTGATTRGDLARSIFEGVSAEIAENIEILEQQEIGPILKICIAGGLTNNSLFNQIQADFYNKVIHLSADRETTALGAWMAAAVAMGEYPTVQDAFNHASEGRELKEYYPDSLAVATYETVKARRKSLYQCLSQNGIYELF